MSLVEAEKLIQKAYDLSAELSPGALKLPEEMFAAGVMNMHYAWYNSGLFNHPEIRREMAEHPNGALVQLIKSLRDSRLADKDYSRETLNKMYGLND